MATKSLIGRWWNSVNPISVLLLPLSVVFVVLVSIRKLAYLSGIKKIHCLHKPVIVVGNISVGGTGKTPLVIWIAEYLKKNGYRPGIISRGYGGHARNWPQQVREDSDPVMVGDEAVMLARRSGCPVCVGPDRVAAANALLSHTQCDIVISDDGLQHYALHRDMEIVVVDGARMFGNGWHLPAGPLRESPRQLRKADIIISNGPNDRGWMRMKIKVDGISAIIGDAAMDSLASFKGKQVHAVAGIGNPERFFSQLSAAGIGIVPHAFPDHHEFTADDLKYVPAFPILMTEKDGVKCQRLGVGDAWSVRISVQPDVEFIQKFSEKLGEISDG
jgi:tetraacyldisaccharide 4'-kinase